MAQEWKIEGKNILVTGGASGLGAAYAETFLKHGAENVAILDIAEKVGQGFAETLNQTYNNRAIFIKCDVSKEEEIENAFHQALNTLKRIDVLINNAGIMDDSADLWRTASDVNWQGLVSFSRKGIEHMRKDQGGSGGTIINISSTAALATVGFVPVYCGSKAAVLHFGRCISTPMFNNDTGIRVLTICFGPTATPLLINIGPKLYDQSISLRLLGTGPINEQRIDSAVKALLKMYREGAPGSVWLSVRDEPVQEITSIISKHYEELGKLVFGEVGVYAPE